MKIPPKIGSKFKSKDAEALSVEGIFRYLLVENAENSSSVPYFGGRIWD